MANAKKVAKKSAEQQAVDAFKKKYEGKDLTDEQKATLAGLTTAARSVRFKASAVKRADTALKAIEGLQKLSRLPHTPEQIATLKTAFQTALTACFAAFESPAGGAKSARISL